MGILIWASDALGGDLVANVIKFCVLKSGAKEGADLVVETNRRPLYLYRGRPY